MFPSSFNHYREHKKILVNCKGLQQPWKIYCNKHILHFIFRLFYLWSNMRPSSWGGEVEAHCEKQTQSMSASQCPFTDFHLTSSQVNVSLTSFLQASPVVWSCVAVLISSPLKENKKIKGSSGQLGGCPARVWGYTPSSMPMKSEPFCIVMEAPAALSTNMEVYCPACRAETNKNKCRKSVEEYFMSYSCVSLSSPAAPAVPARWQWISCCYFPSQRSSPVNCNQIKK